MREYSGSALNLLPRLQNAFWGIENTDVHIVTSFDRLHAYMGLFKDHLFPELKAIVDLLGRLAAVKIEERYVLVFSSSRDVSDRSVNWHEFTA